MTKITILQLNIGRRRFVGDELRALSKRYDIMAVQEPTCRGNKVTGFGLMSRIIALSSGKRRPGASIMINNPNLMALGKLTPLQTIAALKYQDTQATTQEETASIFIEAIYPRDDSAQDSENVAFVRRTTVYPTGSALCPPWDIHDLRIAVDRQKMNRSPGLDAIDAA